MEKEKKSGRGGARPGSGPKMKYKGGRTCVNVSCGAEQKKQLQDKAAAAGLSLTDFILTKCGIKTENNKNV